MSDVRPDISKADLNYVEVPDISLVYTAWIRQKFYLGSMPETYDGLPVQVVISCVDQVAKNKNGIDVLMIPMNDSMYREDQPTEEQLKRWLRAMHAVIDGRDVLIHCHAGMNRSALMMVLYLMEYHPYEFKERNQIIECLKERRSPLLQNSYFERIIEEWKTHDGEI